MQERVAALLPRVTYLHAAEGPAREAIFRMRYDAYRREGSIAERADGSFSDPVDDQPNCYLVGVAIDGALAGAIRVSVSLPWHPDIPTGHVFGDVLQRELAAGTVIVDPTRFVADKDLSRAYPELPYLTLRVPWLAMEHFQAEIMLAAVRPEHQAFYRKLWGHVTICEARPYPNLAKPVALMALYYPLAKGEVHARHPFFRSVEREREAMFGVCDRVAALRPPQGALHRDWLPREEDAA